jgi:hypothetical protein
MTIHMQVKHAAVGLKQKGRWAVWAGSKCSYSTAPACSNLAAARYR